MKKNILLLIFILNLSAVYSQRETNIWYFGHYAGLDFNTGSPIPLTDGVLSRLEGVATMSDRYGNLICYTDGSIVWNKEHDIMPNGTGLLGDMSSTESAIIVPYPQHDSLYYVFTVDEEGTENGLCYSVININLENGLGDITDEKNIQLETPITEKVTAVKHKNNEDIWIVSHGWETDSFFVYSITPDGINTTPDIYEVGTRHIEIGMPGNNTVGYMRVDPTGQKIALVLQVVQLIEIFDFNNETGEVSNPITIEDTGGSPYGVEFSPDGSMLYVTSFYDLHQINLMAGTPDDIINSYTLIGSSDIAKFFGAIQLATDGKIYLCHKNSEYLGVINNPTELGLDCNFDLYGLHLDGGISRMGLPNFLQTYFIPPGFNYQDYCVNDSTFFHIEDISNIDSVNWDFGDPISGDDNFSKLFTPKHVFSIAGNFEVNLILYREGVPYNKNQIVIINPLPEINLGNDTIICLEDTITLNAYFENANYLWNDFSTDSVLKIYETGTYWVKLTNIYTNCVNSDTLKLLVSPPPEFWLGNDTSFCTNDSIILLVSYPKANFYWSNFSSDTSITVLDVGQYWLQITDSLSCINFDTIVIGEFSLPTVNLGKDTIICPDTYIYLGIGQTGNYLWNTGDILNVLEIDTSGLYWLNFVDINGCKGQDSLYISQKFYPEFSLDNDTIFCEGEIVILKSNIENVDYLWQDNSSDSLFVVVESGIYWLKVTNVCGSLTDSININYKYCGEIYIPNIITPNNDYINDYFKIKGIEDLEWSLEIKNRWGQTIFQTDDYQNDWKAENEVDGVYYYILQNKQFNQKYYGFVHVYHGIRN